MVMLGFPSSAWSENQRKIRIFPLLLFFFLPDEAWFYRWWAREKPHFSCFFHFQPLWVFDGKQCHWAPRTMAGLRRLPGSPLSWCLFLTIQGLWNILQTESKEMLWQSISYLTVHLLSVPLWTTLAVFSGSWAFVLTLVLLSNSLQVGFHLTPKSWASVKGYKAQWFLVFIHSAREQFPGRLGPGSAQRINEFMKTTRVFSVQWKYSKRFWCLLSEVRNKTSAQLVSKPLRESM